MRKRYTHTVGAIGDSDNDDDDADNGDEVDIENDTKKKAGIKMDNNSANSNIAA